MHRKPKRLRSFIVQAGFILTITGVVGYMMINHAPVRHQITPPCMYNVKNTHHGRINDPCVQRAYIFLPSPKADGKP